MVSLSGSVRNPGGSDALAQVVGHPRRDVTHEGAVANSVRPPSFGHLHRRAFASLAARSASCHQTCKKDASVEARLGSLLDDEGRRLLERIKSGGRRMEILIDSLLKFARSTRVDLKFAAVDLHELSVSVVAEAHPAYANAEVSIGELPDVWGDRILLREVVVNLVDNALKYSSKTARPRVEIGHLQNDRGSVFFVCDNGVGFDPKYAEILFVPFKRLHNESEYPGTGIGLALCKRIIERQNGRIWAESTLGKGARFFFTLPLAPHAS